MALKPVLYSSVFSAIFGIITSQVSLPILTSQTQFLDSISCVTDGIARCLGGADLISWFSILISIFAEAFILLILTRSGGILEGQKTAVTFSIAAGLLAIPIVVIACWIFVTTSPAGNINPTQWGGISNFLSWPSLAMVLGVPPQTVWISSSVLFSLMVVLAYSRITRRTR